MRSECLENTVFKLFNHRRNPYVLIYQRDSLKLNQMGICGSDSSLKYLLFWLAFVRSCCGGKQFRTLSGFHQQSFLSRVACCLQVAAALCVIFVPGPSLKKQHLPRTYHYHVRWKRSHSGTISVCRCCCHHESDAQT